MVTPVPDIDAAFERAAALLADASARFGSERLRVAKERITEYRHFWIVPWYVTGERLAGAGPAVVPKDGREPWISSSGSPVGAQIRERVTDGPGLGPDEPDSPLPTPVADAEQAAVRVRWFLQSSPAWAARAAGVSPAAVQDRGWCWLVPVPGGPHVAVTKDGQQCWSLPGDVPPDESLSRAKRLLAGEPGRR